MSASTIADRIIGLSDEKAPTHTRKGTSIDRLLNACCTDCRFHGNVFAWEFRDGSMIIRDSLYLNWKAV